jgi:hypothetical protein
VVKGNIRNNLHAACGFNSLARFGDQQHLEGGCFLASTFFVQPSGRKHLKGTAEIEDLYFIEKYDPDSFAIHSNYWKKSNGEDEP